MGRAYYLDSSPLGLVADARLSNQTARSFRAKLRRLADGGDKLFVPSIIEFELKRELLRLNAYRSLADLAEFVDWEPDRRVLLTQEALDLAASTWALQRQQGRPTADRHSLDVDVILAAQVQLHDTGIEDRLVITSNAEHLSPMVPCIHWADV